MQAALAAEVAVKMRALLEEIAEAHSEGVWAAVRLVEDADVALASARSAHELRLVRPSWRAFPGCGLRARGLRHPIVEALLERRGRQEPFVPNDVSLGVDGVDGVLLYGVNSVGKSSIMKAVGLAVVAAQAGMFVAADALELGERPFTGIYTRIGLRDDLARGHSTFVVEMLELRAILRRASARSLVIGDELCAGTEAQSALAIVGAGVVTLAKRGARFAFATHLHELPRLPQVAAIPGVRAMHLAARFDDKKLVLERRLAPGTGPPTYGLEVARSLDMDAEFVRVAESIRGDASAAGNSIPDRRSRYNARLVVDRCAVCGGRADETHHIEPQRTADPRTVHRLSNLAPLCERCHDAVHRGEVEIAGYVATSEGVELRVRGKKKDDDDA